MGFIKRLFGLEVKPGEPEKLSDNSFDAAIAENDKPCFVHFYSLCNASSQVMSGLLNEIGPDYMKKASFYKMNIRDNPYTPQKLKITGILVRSADPIWYTYDIMVIITGMVIIGFSMGFTLRKPKGF